MQRIHSIFKKYRAWLVVVLVFGCVLFAASALAALQTPWPKSPFGTDVMQLDKDKQLNIAIFVKYIYEWGIALGGVATFIAFVIAGFQYITSIGNPQTMKDAMDRIKSAVFGLVMLLSAYVLLGTINKELTTFKLQPFNPVSVGDIYPSCDDAGDCPSPSENYQCVSAGDKDNPGKKICVPKPADSVVCSRARICQETGFETWTESGGLQERGDCSWISPGEIKENNVPKSVRAYYKDPDTGKEMPCDERGIADPNDPDSRVSIGDKNGCGCLLRLFGENISWLWSSCGDVIKHAPAYEPDLTKWADRDVYCVGLIIPTEETP